MNLRLKWAAVLLGLLTLGTPALASCTWPPLFGLSIAEIATCTGLTGDYRPEGKTSSFYIDSPMVCCSARVSGAPNGTEVTASWKSLSGGRSGQGTPVRQDRVAAGGDCYVGFILTAPPLGFDSGDYCVDLSADGKPLGRAAFTISRDPVLPLPKVESFTASPGAITAGQQSSLNWKVSGATRLEIQPSVGVISLEGSRAVNPLQDTTYNLYAVNRGGSVCNTIIVNVSPQIKEKADLQVLEFWSSGNILSYRVRNNGSAASCPTTTYLYRNDIIETEDYVAPLGPGEERAEAFQQYHFSPRFGSTTTSSKAQAVSEALNIRICANGDSACTETDLANNCIEHNFGPLLTVDLTDYASAAKWRSNTAELFWPVLMDSRDGIASPAGMQASDGLGYPEAILVSPPRNGGWVQGTFGIMKGAPLSFEPFVIPHKCKFTCKIGLTRDAQVPPGTRFLVGILQDNETSFFAPVTADVPGKVAAYEFDLGGMAGKKIYFILRVEGGGPWQQGSAAWIEPTLIQEY